MVKPKAIKYMAVNLFYLSSNIRAPIFLLLIIYIIAKLIISPWSNPIVVCLRRHFIEYCIFLIKQLRCNCFTLPYAIKSIVFPYKLNWSGTTQKLLFILLVEGVFSIFDSFRSIMLAILKPAGRFVQLLSHRHRCSNRRVKLEKLFDKTSAQRLLEIASTRFFFIIRYFHKPFQTHSGRVPASFLIYCLYDK